MGSNYWQATWEVTAGRLHESSLASCFKRKAGGGVTHPPPIQKWEIRRERKQNKKESQKKEKKRRGEVMRVSQKDREMGKAKRKPENEKGRK